MASNSSIQIQTEARVGSRWGSPSAPVVADRPMGSGCVGHDACALVLFSFGCDDLGLAGETQNIAAIII